MCGITARVGTDDALEELLTSLSNLEYRGYDSAGVALLDGDLDVCKCEGETDDLRAAVESRRPSGPIGLGHTRWSTHGPPTDENAHPHTGCSDRVAVVHNGIIENYESLRTELRSRGHEFTSDTDTEVVPHLIEERLDAGRDPEAAFREVVDVLEGSYAVALAVEDDDVVYATRNGSPLVVGIGQEANYLASDIPAFLEFTDRVVYLEDDEVAVVGPDDVRFTDVDGRPIVREPQTVDWAAGDAEKSGYNHYMLKEINEQPVALRQAVEGRTDPGAREIDLEDLPPGTFDDVERVLFVACGTSYHAAMYATSLLQRRGVAASTSLASEFANEPMPLDESTLVVAVTQSGETADTLAALREADRAGARTLAVTNVVGSTAAREVDDVCYIRAGPEIGVAATKTFSSQVATLGVLAERLRGDVGDGEPPDEAFLRGLERLPDAVDSILEANRTERIADSYAGMDSYFFIGRGIGYPVALEGALKFKEITYEHAEGFAAGELKHGPLALVTTETVVVAVFTGENDEKTLHNVREVQSRGAPVVAVAPESATEVHRAVDDVVEIPDAPEELSGLLSNVVLQLLSYHAADLRDRPIDKPRNLAKSVTVE
ncbi:glutamine--fructose-6-phosphate transaminase (isomerizing) [Natronomonas salina]|uniref:glutamine--fructose-6-phosphate transaminase (isomerizing) n=1 Tax=Natronomonas salina TaxID=1710540 RepID=UPI0015B3CA53|nr:glutamine--fructose-6-phosphate transaminase (isomerizing) [Natronomonas salina]QLD88682.1 glutamine--fructose-6-phosphate transaminase (isomerizing) [Natronomonas salina]